MGNRDVSTFDDDIVEEKQIEIQGTRTPMDSSLSAGIRLDAMEPAEQRIRIEFGFDDDDHVQIRALIERSANGICLEDFGLGNNGITETVDGELEVSDAVSEVRPESDDCFMSGQP